MKESQSEVLCTFFTALLLKTREIILHRYLKPFKKKVYSAKEMLYYDGKKLGTKWRLIN
jgi:hypothetical protein